MKVIFFGTSEFAIPTLQKLKEGGFDILAVVTQPDKPAGRKQQPLPSPVKKWALAHNIKVLQPKILDSTFHIPYSDLYIVTSYGKIIPREIIEIPKFGTLNIHPSLLPKYRGASPIHAAILNGDIETGVSIIKMDEEMDHGSIIAQSKFEIRDSRFYFKELHDKLAELAAKLLIDALPKYLSDEIRPVPQDDARATFTKIITKQDARIDWSRSAEEIVRAVQAFSTWPVAWTTLLGKRIKIYEGEVASSRQFPDLPPGTIFMDKTGKKNLRAACGQNTHLEIKRLQQEGGRIMSALAFLHGQRNLEGPRFV